MNDVITTGTSHVSDTICTARTYHPEASRCDAVPSTTTDGAQLKFILFHFDTGAPVEKENLICCRIGRELRRHLILFSVYDHLFFLPVDPASNELNPLPGPDCRFLRLTAVHGTASASYSRLVVSE